MNKAITHTTLNTRENKEKFFAQYWGQIIARCERFVSPGFHNRVDISLIKHDISDFYLELIPLTSIDNNHVFELLKRTTAFNPNLHIIYELKKQGSFTIAKVKWKSNGKIKYREIHLFAYNIETYHFLQSKGYALDWNGITVEQQLEFGWIKLI